MGNSNILPTPHLPIEIREIVATFGETDRLYVGLRPEDVRNLNVPKLFPPIQWLGVQPAAKLPEVWGNSGQTR